MRTTTGLIHNGIFTVRKNASAQSVVNEIGRNISKLTRLGLELLDYADDAKDEGRYSDAKEMSDNGWELRRLANFLSTLQGHVARVTDTQTEDGS